MGALRLMATVAENPRLIENANTAVPHERFTLRQRLAIWLISWFGYLALRLIGPTLRFTSDCEENVPDPTAGPTIFCFWHRSVGMATYLFRNRGIAVLTSSSFDGEYIARIIEKFGYVAVRGSSTRGGVRALLSMHRDLKANRSVAFTIDGPKGPLYVAKPGPLLLARNTQIAIRCFHIAADRSWNLRTWDRFIVPKPFARAHVQWSKLIHVPPSFEGAPIDRWLAELQSALDRVRAEAEARIDTRTSGN
jgi:lysophospholipid acyltransferase (LPLAT)-like uncharacterized protein